MIVEITEFFGDDEEKNTFDGLLLTHDSEIEVRFDLEDVTYSYRGAPVREGQWLLRCSENGCRASLSESPMNPGSYEGTFFFKAPNGHYEAMWQIDPVED